MVELASHLPGWVSRLVWSLVTVVCSSLLGHLVTRTVCTRLSRWASKTAWKWDDLLIGALRRGIPLWSLLLGLYIAVGLWPLSAHVLTMLTDALYVLTWLSVTLISAGLAGRLVALYGSQVQHALPVTGLTQHLAKILVTILGLLMILHGMGISITPLLTALGVG